MADPVKVLFDVNVPQNGVVKAPFNALKTMGDLVVPGGVGVASCRVSLWQVAILVPTPWGEEGGQVPVLLSERHKVVALPGVQDRLLAVGWHGLALHKWCLGLVGLSYATPPPPPPPSHSFFFKFFITPPPPLTSQIMDEL